MLTCAGSAFTEEGACATTSWWLPQGLARPTAVATRAYLASPGLALP
ncbi:hypothetical protein [Nostocoides sp. F2B08]|nr:hypothetical protein [Tetrasphaera sp. F2B08]